MVFQTPSRRKKVLQKPFEETKEGKLVLRDRSGKGQGFRRRIRPKALIRAIKGTGGNMTQVAAKLKVRRAAVTFCIHKKHGPEWDKVRKAFESECESAVDDAQETVRYLIKQRKDLVEAGKNSRWILEKRRREQFGDNKTLTLEGGKNPIKQENVINLDVLDKLPVEARRAILEAIEQGMEQADQGVKRKKGK